MGLQLPPQVVADIEWAVVSLTGLIAVVSLLGALYSVPWTFRSRQQAATRAFNYLWITRALLQVIAALYALSLDLRLQVLWSAKSVLIDGGYNVDAMCRLYIGLSFGLLEPSFLLLVLFACMYTVHKHTSEPGSNPNLFIFALTVGLTLPMCAAQVFAALFSRIMSQLRYNEDLMYKFFAASASVGPTMCPEDPGDPNCAVCLFPEFSTLISAGFALLYLLVLWAVLGRVASTAINRLLARRIRLLQICITLFFCASITLRGVTVVNIDPYSLDFVALWLANVVVASGLILVVSAILVWVPVYDGRRANARLGALCPAPLLLDGPTELLPLVGYGRHKSHDGPPGSSSSDYDADSSVTDLATRSNIVSNSLVTNGSEEGLLGRGSLGSSGAVAAAAAAAAEGGGSSPGAAAAAAAAAARDRGGMPRAGPQLGAAGGSSAAAAAGGGLHHDRSGGSSSRAAAAAAAAGGGLGGMYGLSPPPPELGVVVAGGGAGGPTRPQQRRRAAAGQRGEHAGARGDGGEYDNDGASLMS